MLGSFPLFSDFKLGRFAGGGMRRAVATFPRLCKPCLGITAGREGWKQTAQGKVTEGKRPGPCSCVFELTESDKGNRERKPGAAPSAERSEQCLGVTSVPFRALRQGLQRRRSCRVPAEAPLLLRGRGRLREFMTWVRSQARAPPSHTVTISLATEMLWPHYSRTEGHLCPGPGQA